MENVSPKDHLADFLFAFLQSLMQDYDCPYTLTGYVQMMHGVKPLKKDKIQLWKGRYLILSSNFLESSNLYKDPNKSYH